MQVQTLAEEICKYTILKVANNKIIAKRNYKTIGAQIVNHTFAMCQYIVTANELDLFNEEESKERLMLQKKAFSESLGLMSMIDVAASLKQCDDAYEHWSELVSEEQKLIKGWMQSDNSRKKSSVT